MVGILISLIYSLLVQAILYRGFNAICIVNTIFVTHVLGAYFAKLMERKIGGITGDTLGAVLELSQLVVLFGIYISLGVFVTHVLGAYFAKLMERKIGGITGDTLGAVLELSQLVVLFGIYISLGVSL